MKPDDTLEFTAALAQEAGRLAQSLRRKAKADFVSPKGELDFVTHADRAVETFIRSRIADAFPGAGIFGDEEGGEAAETLWVIDPIDGTTNYLKGLPDWGTCIARVENGAITHGVTVCPDLNLTAIAIRGGGAFLNGARLRAESDRSVVLVHLGYSPRTELSQHLDQIARVISHGADYRRSGAACVGLLNVAAGWADLYYERHLNLWDAAPGLLLVSEAGGACGHASLAEFTRKGSEVLAMGKTVIPEARHWSALFGTPARDSGGEAASESG